MSTPNPCGRLYLIPSMIGKCPADYCIPPYNIQIVNRLSHFIVEETSSAYRTLRHIGFNGSFDNVTLYQLNEHSRPEDITEYLECTKDDHDIGLLSEAGLPCLADPGAYVVRLAHSKDIQVIPLTGPSSIVSAIISSGMNGQCFAFHGYLPIKSPQKENKIKSCEKYSAEFHQTQVFIEAPYRNNQLFNTLISICLPTTLLSIACNVNSDDEYISMKSISEWRKSDAPDLHKKPTVFCLLAN